MDRSLPTTLYSPPGRSSRWPKQLAQFGRLGLTGLLLFLLGAGGKSRLPSHPRGSRNHAQKLAFERIFPTRPATATSISLSSASRAQRGFRTTGGFQSAKSWPGSFKKQTRIDPSTSNCLALAGDTLEKQHLTLTHLGRRPDILVIYCGHNEFYSRLWWSRNIDHYIVDQRPSRFGVMVGTLEGCSSVCSLIRELAAICRIAIPPPANTRRDLVDVPVYTAEEYRLLLADFRNRLDEMVTYAERVGALPVLILPPANDADFEPNRSYLPPLTPRAERESIRTSVPGGSAARSRRSGGRQRGAIAELVARQPCFAEAHYRFAQLLEQSGDWEEAYRQYIAARDADGMPMRCLSSFQQAYRDVASRHGCILIDGQNYFHLIGRHGLLDDELFQDAMHPSLRGQIARVASGLGCFAQKARIWVAGRFPSSNDRPVGVCPSFWNRQKHLAIDRNVVEGIQRTDDADEIRP